MDWVEAISSAVENFRSRVATLSTPAAADAAAATAGSGMAGAPLGSVAPLWVPDDRVTMCQVKKSKCLSLMTGSQCARYVRDSKCFEFNNSVTMFQVKDSKCFEVNNRVTMCQVCKGV